MYHYTFDFDARYILAQVGDSVPSSSIAVITNGQGARIVMAERSRPSHYSIGKTRLSRHSKLIKMMKYEGLLHHLLNRSARNCTLCQVHTCLYRPDE